MLTYSTPLGAHFLARLSPIVRDLGTIDRLARAMMGPADAAPGCANRARCRDGEQEFARASLGSPAVRYRRASAATNIVRTCAAAYERRATSRRASSPAKSLVDPGRELVA